MKSHVSMEQKVCPVCGKSFDSGAILFDRRLQASMERTTVTGWQLCETDQGHYDAGFIALVEATPPTDGDLLTPGTAHRLGRIAHLKVEAFRNVFDLPASDADGKMIPMMFIDPEAFDALERMAP